MQTPSIRLQALCDPAPSHFTSFQPPRNSRPPGTPCHFSHQSTLLTQGLHPYCPLPQMLMSHGSSQPCRLCSNVALPERISCSCSPAPETGPARQTHSSPFTFLRGPPPTWHTVQFSVSASCLSPHQNVPFMKTTVLGPGECSVTTF